MNKLPSSTGAGNGLTEVGGECAEMQMNSLYGTGSYLDLILTSECNDINTAECNTQSSHLKL